MCLRLWNIWNIRHCFSLNVTRKFEDPLFSIMNTKFHPRLMDFENINLCASTVSNVLFVFEIDFKPSANAIKPVPLNLLKTIEKPLVTLSYMKEDLILEEVYSLNAFYLRVSSVDSVSRKSLIYFIRVPYLIAIYFTKCKERWKHL